MRSNAHVDEVNDQRFDAADLATDGRLCDFAGRLTSILPFLHMAADDPRDLGDPIQPVGAEVIERAVAVWGDFRVMNRRVRWRSNGSS